MAEGINYNRICINQPPAQTSSFNIWPECSEETTIAATYDYVGAVYGKEGKVKYDGVLTSDEMAYVEQTFGVLTTSQNVFQYVSNARNLFFEKDAKKAYSAFKITCDDPSFSYDRYECLLSKDVVVIGGSHLCGNRIGKLYGNVELEIAANPADWVFFVEGSHMEEERKQQEIDLFSRLATTLEIPIYEALVSAFDKQAFKQVARNLNISELELAVSCAVLFAVNIKASGGGVAQVDYMFIGVSNKTGIAIDKLYAAFNIMFPPELSNEAFKVKQNKAVEFATYLIVSAVNDLSVNRLKAMLIGSGKKHILFEAGLLHREIMSRVCSE